MTIPNDPDYVRIFDTTLRDGEQSPGATMTSAEKLEIAAALSRLGVDVIETGFPAASPDDLSAVRAIAEGIGVEVTPGRPQAYPPTICALARAATKDIDKAWEAVRGAKFPRIHVFVATSDIHMEHKLRMTREQVLEKIRSSVTYARERCADIEFSPEDGARSDPAFLYRALETAIEAGASTLNIPDTVGYTTPDEFGALIAGIKQNVRGIDKVVLSVHCHDDLGLGCANTLAGIRNGARQVEVTINGLGERAGNSALEEVVMALHTRRPLFGLRTGIDTTQLLSISKLVSSATGFTVPANKAVVGANAFAHESGIHQDGMLKHGATYEIMRPETVGATHSNLVLGKHSGRHALRKRIEQLGHAIDEAKLEEVFAAFKALADKKKRVVDADIEALLGATTVPRREFFQLDALQVACGTTGLPTATVRLRGPDGTMHVSAQVGTGPVHAAFCAIDTIVGTPTTLLEFTVHSVTAGIDALGEVSVRVRGDAGGKRNPQHEVVQPRVFHGQGADTDIVVASAKAYLTAINRFLATEESEGKERGPRSSDAPPGPITAPGGHG